MGLRGIDNPTTKTEMQHSIFKLKLTADKRFGIATWIKEIVCKLMERQMGVTNWYISFRKRKFIENHLRVQWPEWELS